MKASKSNPLETIIVTLIGSRSISKYPEGWGLCNKSIQTLQTYHALRRDHNRNKTSTKSRIPSQQSNIKSFVKIFHVTFPGESRWLSYSVCLEFHRQKKPLPSRKLTYPTWGKGTSSSFVPLNRGQDCSLLRGIQLQLVQLQFLSQRLFVYSFQLLQQNKPLEHTPDPELAAYEVHSSIFVFWIILGYMGYVPGVYWNVLRHILFTEEFWWLPRQTLYFSRLNPPKKWPTPPSGKLRP